MKTLICGAGPIGRLFGSPKSEIRFGLHARAVGPELLELADEFRQLAIQAGLATPTMDEFIDSVRWYEPIVGAEEVA